MVDRHAIKKLREEARAAQDWAQYALCELAMQRHASFQECCEDRPEIKPRLRELGVLPEDACSEGIAVAECARVIADKRR